MAIEPLEFWGDAVNQSQAARAIPRPDGIRPGKIAAIAAATLLPHMTALAWDEANERWIPFDPDLTNEEFTLTAASTTASDGDFTLTFEGETTAAIDHDAAAAAIVTALEGLSNVDAGDVAVVDSGGGLAEDDGVATITFQGQYAGTPVALSATYNLTGSDHVLANTETGAGAAAARFDGILWEPTGEGVQSHATNDVIAQVFREGTVHFDDIVDSAGDAIDAGDVSYFQDLRVRQLGLIVTGLADTP